MSAKVPVGHVVDVNTASFESLRDSVVGIGPVLAGRIVSYREKHGPFASVSELAKVQGIGPRLLERIGDQITVGEGRLPTVAAATPSGASGEGAESGAEIVAALTEHAPQSDEVLPLAEDLGPSGAEGEDVAEERAQEEGSAGVDDSSAPGSPSVPPVQGQGEAQVGPKSDITSSQMAEGSSTSAPKSSQPIEGRAPMGSPGDELGSHPPTTMARAAYEAPTRPAGRGDSLWQKLLLVLLGGLLGMVLTLIIMLIVSGTLDFAPHREVVALSRNLGTMRSDQEMAWQRIEQLSQRVGELERQVRRLEALSDRVAGLEKDLAAIRDDTKKLAAAFDALRSDVGKELSRLDQRVAEMQGTVQRIQERVRRFDTFFTSLRDLLDEMQGPAQSAEGQEPGALPTPEGR